MKTCVYIWLVLVWFVGVFWGEGGWFVLVFFKDTFPSVMEQKRDKKCDGTKGNNFLIITY